MLIPHHRIRHDSRRPRGHQLLVPRSMPLRRRPAAAQLRLATGAALARLRGFRPVLEPRLPVLLGGRTVAHDHCAATSALDVDGVAVLVGRVPLAFVVRHLLDGFILLAGVVGGSLGMGVLVGVGVGMVLTVLVAIHLGLGRGACVGHGEVVGSWSRVPNGTVLWRILGGGVSVGRAASRTAGLTRDEGLWLILGSSVAMEGPLCIGLLSVCTMRMYNLLLLLYLLLMQLLPSFTHPLL
jgi:hypothetical protein